MARKKIDLLISNAAQVVTCSGPVPKTGGDLQDIGLIENGSVACNEGQILWVGKTEDAPHVIKNTDVYMHIDATGKVVMPGFVDPHTHLVFGGSREEEFAKKLQGVPYLKILREGGGILDTVEKTRNTSYQDLYQRGLEWLGMMLGQGTTTVEIKSGYGLNMEHELRILRVIHHLSLASNIDITSTFLGAHAWPKGKSHKEYIEELIQMLDLVQSDRFTEFCDVFCEKDAFSLEESREILQYASSLNMKLKIHAGEFNDLGGARLAAELGATSLDHGEHISPQDALLLAEKQIAVVLMPGVNFHLGSEPAYARRLIAMGVPVALASDFNPGSSPVLSMQFIIQLACRMYGMTMEEAINAATINAAYALDRHQICGSIEESKQADLLVLDIPNYNQLPYWVARNSVETVIKSGYIVKSRL